MRMRPKSGRICGRLTYDLPLGCLQGGFRAYLIENEAEVGRFGPGDRSYGRARVPLLA